MRLLIATLVFVTVFAGCMMSSPSHPWENVPWHMSSPPQEPDWTKLPPTDYQRVQDAMMPEAVARLDTQPWIALRHDEVPRLLGGSTLNPPASALPYLIRGVVRGPKSDVTLVFTNHRTSGVFIFHGLITPELALPVNDAPHPVALVVYLPAAPDEVFLDGAMGGDGMMGLAIQKGADRR